MNKKYFNTKNRPDIIVQGERDEAKKNVVLDLDNTLIFAEYMKKFPFEDKKIRTKSIRFELHDMDGYYIVFERPSVQLFLDRLFQKYNVSVWTAASKDYALFIVKHVILARPGRKLDYILFSHHCELSDSKYSDSKNLKMLSEHFGIEDYNLTNTIIIDDHPEVYNTQPDNAIQIKVFDFMEPGSERDDEIMRTFYQLDSKFEALGKK